MRTPRAIVTSALAALALTALGLTAAPGASAAPFPTNDSSVNCNTDGTVYTNTFIIPLTLGETHVIAMRSGFSPPPGQGGCDIRVSAGDSGVVQWTSSKTGATINPAFVNGETPASLTFTALKGGTSTVTARFNRDSAYGATYIFTVPEDPTPSDSTPTIRMQGLPMPSSGSCQDINDEAYAWGTGLSGGWQRSWQPWATSNEGFACVRSLVLTDHWFIENAGI